MAIQSYCYDEQIVLLLSTIPIATKTHERKFAIISIQIAMTLLEARFATTYLNSVIVKGIGEKSSLPSVNRIEAQKSQFLLDYWMRRIFFFNCRLFCCCYLNGLVRKRYDFMVEPGVEQFLFENDVFFINFELCML